MPLASSQINADTLAASASTNGSLGVCAGLRSSGVDPASAESFGILCRVVETKFSTISADSLLKLRAKVHGNSLAVDAFNAICSSINPDAPSLFDRAAEHNGIGALHLADRSLAEAVNAFAKQMQQERGGLYEGRLDHLRSTLCTLALGVDASVGCCHACAAILRDHAFRMRLNTRKTKADGRPCLLRNSVTVVGSVMAVGFAGRRRARV